MKDFDVIEVDTPVAKEALERIHNRTACIGVIGLGYVGLPLLYTFHKGGFPVKGVDIDPQKIRAFEEGTPYIRHIGEEVMKELALSPRAEATTHMERVAEADVLLICVPTPLGKHREPDLSFVEQTARGIAPHLRKGQLVVLESTTYPGTTEELLTPILEEGSGLKAGEDFFVAYSPEREDPGNPRYTTATIPKVVGGDTPEARALASALYGSVITRIVPVSSTRTAEAVKLLENIFRSVNIALVNELKVVFERMGIDIYEVIDAAKTKPFGFMAFYPGPGLGGHCIPIDPFYLTWKAREYGLNTRFIELAGEVNTSMPEYVVHRTMEALNSAGKSVRNSRILCLGVAYKPDVDDMRESPSFPVMDRLKELGAEVAYYDPYLPVIPASREHREWEGVRSITWSEDALASYDAVLILTNHSNIDYEALAHHAPLIIDTRGEMRRRGYAPAPHIWQA